jgi:predicted CXXCH cytochrome family protein
MCHEGDADFSETNAIPYSEPATACFTCHTDIVQDAKWRHSPAVGMLCSACHQKGKEGNNIVVHTDEINELCFKCHLTGSKWMDSAYVHAPVDSLDCTVCHDPHGDKYKNFLWADGKLDLCLACHIDKKKLFSINSPFQSIHGIIKGGGCTFCHDPHASEHELQLREKINTLCIGCHPAIEATEGNHPVAGHPMDGEDDPSRPGREISCTSCHDAHGSGYSNLLLGDYADSQLCLRCHD